MKRIKTNGRAVKMFLIGVLAVLLVTGVLAGCSSGSLGGGAKDPLAGLSNSDMSGYSGLEGYEKETVFVDATVSDVQKMMNDKATFVMFAGFANCPWCNALLPYLNDVALDVGMKIAYIDTRRNPEWKSNMDLEGYDEFVEMFGEYLEIDSDGKPHLYVPDLYFVKDGQVVYRHDGVVSGLESPTDTLTDDQEAELRGILMEGFEKLK